MHTTKIDNIVFHHNGDYSGDVEISDENGSTCKVGFNALKGFVAEYVRREKITKIESVWTSYDDILKL